MYILRKEDLYMSKEELCHSIYNVAKLYNKLVFNNKWDKLSDES